MTEHSDRRAADAEAFTLDVVGIGALNLDYIATAAPAAQATSHRRLANHLEHLLAEAGHSFDRGTEQIVDARTINAAIEAVSSTRPKTALGGSAFNAIFAIAQTQVGLRLGFVGVAGRVPVMGLSSIRQFEALNIDHRFVSQNSSRLCGICFSFVEDGERTMLTHDGANAEFADHLDREFDAIVEYLARAKVIHVTSFLDDRSAGRLIRVLSAVKEANPGTAICLDPGHPWSVAGTPEIEALLALSDYLLINHREFRELGRRADGESDEAVAARLVDRMGGGSGVVMVKLPAGIWSYRRERGKLLGDFYAQTPLPKAEIKDDTGAGDVFAAGLLIVLTSDKLQIELGSLLGMRLARHKLRYVGSAGHAQFAEVTRDFIASAAAERRSAGTPRGVFIAHGAHPEWLAVRRFIEDRFDLPVYSFESGSWGGRQVTEALADYLERCSFAVCVLTAEDFAGDGRRLARQNVIHEVGLFQGRHGFDRVAVLAEEGCDFVPEAARPYTIGFSRHGISGVFYQLGEMIRSQGMDLHER